MKAARRIFLAIAILGAVACSDGGGSSDAGADGASDSAMSDGQTDDASQGDGGVDDDGNVEDGDVEEEGGIDDGGVDGGIGVMCPDGGTSADPSTALEACTAFCVTFASLCSVPVDDTCVTECVNDPNTLSWSSARWGRLRACFEISDSEDCVAASNCASIVLECP